MYKYPNFQWIRHKQSSIFAGCSETYYGEELN